MNLNKIFKPKSIAIIGASNQKGSVGYALYTNAKASKVKRQIYAVNIKRKKILGDKAYASVVDIKANIDLAVIATPAVTVPQVLADCAKAKIKGVVIISAGFSEVGQAGAELSEQVLAIAKENGIRIMGPNCLGFLNPGVDLNMSFAAKKALPGQVAFISQSGAMCTAVLDWAEQYNIGFSNFVSIGSALDIGFSDIIEQFAKDKNTTAIVLYMESLKDPARFIKLCKKVSKNKSIFVLKSGRSSAGAEAAKSHTGSLAGADRAFDALFRQSGVVRLESIQDVYDTIKFFSARKTKIGQRLAIITNAGGPGVITTDAIEHQGGQLAKLTKNTIKKLNEKLPSSWSGANPVDIIGDADPARFKIAVNICLADKKVDSILVVLTPQAMTRSLDVAKNLVKIKIPQNKFIFTSFIGGSEVLVAREFLQKNNIPVFETPERAIDGFMNVIKNNQIRNKKATCLLKEDETKVQKEKVGQILSKVRLDKRKQLTEAEAKEVLRCYKIPVLPFTVVRSETEINQDSLNLEYPVAMKILSPDILHKIDCGGVELNINNEEEAQKAYTKIIKSAKSHHPQADIRGVYIESMKKSDLELIIGLSYDPVLGPVLMFGRGGTEVELYKDISFGVLPLSKCEIITLMKETKVYSLLEGYRNMQGVDIEKLAGLVHKIAGLAQDFSIVKELDINPLAIDNGKMTVLDAKIVLK